MHVLIGQSSSVSQRGRQVNGTAVLGSKIHTGTKHRGRTIDLPKPFGSELPLW